MCQLSENENRNLLELTKNRNLLELTKEDDNDFFPSKTVFICPF